MQGNNSKTFQINENLTLQLSILVLITIVAGILRFYKLGEWSFWIDEIATLNRAQASMRELLTVVPTGLSYILTNISLRTFGLSEWSSRLVSTLLGILTIPVIFFPIKAMFDAKSSLIAVLLIAISPWHLFWSQSARFYTSLMLFYFLAMFAFYYGLEKDRFWYIILGIVFFLMAFQERMLSLLLIPVLIIYILSVKWFSFKTPKGFRVKNFLPLIIVGLVGMLFVTFDIYQYASSGSSIIMNKMDWFFNRPIDDPFRLLVFTFLSISIPIGILALLSGGYLILEKSRPGLYLIIGAFIPLILTLLANPFMFTKERYLFMTFPCWAILAAVGIKEIFSRSKGNARLLAWGVLLMLVVTAAVTQLLYFTVNHGNRYDWESVFTLVQERQHEDDVVVSTRPQIGAYYYDGTIKNFSRMAPEKIAENNRNYWFIVDSEKVWDNREMKDWLEKKAALTDFQYLRLPEELNLRVYHYAPGN